jgi:cytochrome bd ubiquinol oxidase subunit II
METMTLQTIWFFLWGILWAIYFMLDGFDLGLGTIIPFVSKEDRDRRVVLNAMGPFWDGNEVWLITAGGVTFAAFPTTYAVMFSTLYSPLLLILFALIIRAVSIEFRGQLEGPGWRKLWDTCLFIGSFAPALLFGVAFANIFQGIPFDANHMLHGGLFDLLNPYGILGGVLFVTTFVVHGTLWLTIKSEGEFEQKAGALATKLWLVLLAVAVVFLVATRFATPLYTNYLNIPTLFAIPLVAVAALLISRYYMEKQEWWSAWFASCLFIVAAVMFGVVGLYPNLFPSSLDPAVSLTAFNSSSSHLTLTIMLVVALVFVPIVIAYQVWAYYTFRGKVGDDLLGSEEAY